MLVGFIAATVRLLQRHMFMTAPRTAVLAALLITWADGHAQSLPPFHHQYVHAQFPAVEERYLPMPSGSTLFYGAGQSAPMFASLGMVDAQGGLLWERRVEFAGIGEAGVRSVRDLGNGTLLCGVRGWYPSKGAVALVDTFGTLPWSVDLGMPISDVILTADGNCVALGWRSILAPPSGGYDIHLIKLDLSGNLLWMRRYADPDNDSPFNALEKYPYNLVEQPNGDLWLSFGYTDQLGVICTDETGNFEWARFYASGVTHDNLLAGGHPYALLPDLSGTWLFGKGRENAGPGGLFAILLDEQGTPVTGRSFSGGSNLFLRDVQRAPDGGFWMFAGDGQDNRFLKLDDTGSPLDQFFLNEGSTRPISGFGVAADDALLLTRWVPDTSQSNAACERERFDPTSNLECADLVNSSIAHSVFTPQVMTAPILMTLPSIPVPFQTLGLAPRYVTVSPGCVPMGLTETRAAAEIKAYPSPATDWVRFSGIDPAYPITVELIDLNGHRWKHTIAGEASLPLHELAPGVYTARFVTDTGDPATVRFIKAERPD